MSLYRSVCTVQHGIGNNIQILFVKFFCQVPYNMALAIEKKIAMEQAAQAESKTVAHNKNGGDFILECKSSISILLM